MLLPQKTVKIYGFIGWLMPDKKKPCNCKAFSIRSDYACCVESTNTLALNSLSIR